MSSKLPQMSQMRVLRAEIYVDDSINSRQSYDEKDASPAAEAYRKKIGKLADSMKVQGVIHPPVLLRMSQTGGEYDGDKAAKGCNYLLVVGFRRQRAMDSLGQEEATYSIAPSSWTLGDAKAANLVENLGREDLTTYETAITCAGMKDDYGWTGGEIAKRIRAMDGDPEGKSVLSEIHVNNMIRCARNLHPEILEAWKAQVAAASLRRLIRLSAIEDEAEQLATWKKETGEASEGSGGEDEKGGGDKDGRKKRPSDAAVVTMLDAIKASDKDEAWKKGATAGILWAVGTPGHERIPGVKWEPAAPRSEKVPGGAEKTKKGGKKGKKGSPGKDGAADGAAADAS